LKAAADGLGDIINADDVAFVKAAAEVVDGWLGEMTANGRDKQHVAQCRSHCRGILEKAGIVYLKDLTKDKAKTALAELERERGWSPRTYDSWLVDFKTFIHSCMDKGYIMDDLTKGIKKKEKTERRRVRRALKPAELIRLIDADFNSPKTIAGMTGPMRALLYIVASLTGWRWSELRKIQRMEVYLNEEIPYTAPAAEKQKSKRSDIVVLRADVMELLRGRFALNPLQSDAAVFKMPVGNEGGAMIAHDLRHTGDTPETIAEKRERGEEPLAAIPLLDEHGRIVDFHALRHSLATMLDRAGVPLGVRHQIMRHRADKSLTLATYTHSDFVDQKEALDSLPDLIPPAVWDYFVKGQSGAGAKGLCQTRAKNDATYCHLLANSESDGNFDKEGNVNATSA
jgi:integrase